MAIGDSANIQAMDAVGEAILEWADPENKYRGYTEVSTYLIATSLETLRWIFSGRIAAATARTDHK